MDRYAQFAAFVSDHRARNEQARREADGQDLNAQDHGRRHVLSPVIQHSKLGAYGGLGDFVSQTSALFPEIEWAIPLTEKIRAHAGDTIGPPLVKVPVDLVDPVNGDVYTFDFDVHAHQQPNGSVSWLFYNQDLMDPTTAFQSILAADRSLTAPELRVDHRFFALSINQNTYDSTAWSEAPVTLANTPELHAIHPLLRRYITRPDMLDAIMQGAMSKAIVRLMTRSGVDYDVLWVHDWHFAATAGELLLPEHREQAGTIQYVQHLHNALYQGIYASTDLLAILGWPASHYARSLFKVHGNVNLLGGALNALRHGRLRGRAVAVSRTHAHELPTVERGAGLHHIFSPLHTDRRLAGLNNPIVVPDNLPISDETRIEQDKSTLKAEVQAYFGLDPRPDAFLLLWSHRFTHQKQAAAVLRALELLLETGNGDLQVAFFCDTAHGSNPYDVAKLHSLIDRFPDSIANRPFDPRKEMTFAAGVDGALMASYFEPFGYAPVWVGLQGGFILTGANGGQVDIFDPDATFFIDIRPDVDKPNKLKDLSLGRLYEYLFVGNDSYRQYVFDHNTNSVKTTILQAKAAFQNRETRNRISVATMRRITALAQSDYFPVELQEILFGGEEIGNGAGRMGAGGVPADGMPANGMRAGGMPAGGRWSRFKGTIASALRRRPAGPGIEGKRPLREARSDAV